MNVQTAHLLDASEGRRWWRRCDTCALEGSGLIWQILTSDSRLSTTGDSLAVLLAPSDSRWLDQLDDVAHALRVALLDKGSSISGLPQTENTKRSENQGIYTRISGSMERE